MPVTDVRKDTATSTMTITARFDATPERVWQLWADPRQLERWWGPPTYPATVVEHDLRPGGRVRYHMTGPEGDQHGGYWDVIAVDPPHSLEVRDGFADGEGNPNADMPTTGMRVTIEAQPAGGTQMTIASRFDSAEEMQQMVEMGMEEGMSAAMSQIDDVLREEVGAR